MAHSTVLGGVRLEAGKVDPSEAACI